MTMTDNDDDENEGADDLDGDASEIDALGAELANALRRGIEELRTEDPDTAIEIFSRVALQARAAELPLMEASACGMLGQALLLVGRREEGMPHALRALEIAEEVGNEEAIGNFQALVQALSAEEEPENEGEVDPEQAEVEAILDGLNARIKAAMEEAMAGDPVKAVDELVEVVEEAQNIGAMGPEASAQIGIGQLLLASGNNDLAVVSLRRALAIAERLENNAAAEHIRELLERAG